MTRAWTAKEHADLPDRLDRIEAAVEGIQKTQTGLLLTMANERAAKIEVLERQVAELKELWGRRHEP